MQWLEDQKKKLLPVTHFLLTFTLPGALRRIARRHQILFYNLLFTCAAAALQTLAQDFKFLGGMAGMFGILHTWGRDLSYHPHSHFIVPGIAYFKKGDALLFAGENFLVPVKALSIVFRAKFRDGLQKADKTLFDGIPQGVWKQDWVVHSQQVGSGEAAFTYLANYVFRVAISNNRILQLHEGKITFEVSHHLPGKYRESETKQFKTMTLDVFEFMRRFLQHVLPKGFVKVRYYGFWASANKNIWKRIQQLLGVKEQKGSPDEKNNTPKPMLCPHCRKELIFIAEVKPGESWPHAPPPRKGVNENITHGAYF